MLVGGNCAPKANLQPGFFSQHVLRAHANGKDHHLGIHLAVAGKAHLQPASFAFFDGLQSIAQCQANALKDQVLVHQRSHFIVYRCHHLVEHFNQGHLYAAML